MKRQLRTIASAAAFVLIVTLLLRELAPGPASAPDFDGRNRGPEVVVHIESGMTGSEIGELLFKENVVASSLAYFRAAVSDTRSGRIAPGEHRVETRISAKEAIQQLLDPDRIVNLVRVRDGARFIEIREALINAGFSENEINKSYRSLKLSPEIALLIADARRGNIEGIFYPAFYSFPKDTTADQALDAMIDRFGDATDSVEWRYQDFKPNELLTIASLVESEGTPDVFGRVARVIYNRLEKGMKLQFDSTVHYLFDRRGEIALSIADTKTKSPYNTFINPGLPPGPIGSPTLAAIQATLKPETGDWLYFVTVMPGTTKFTSSYDEFLEYKAEYKRNYAKGAFG